MGYELLEQYLVVFIALFGGITSAYGYYSFLSPENIILKIIYGVISIFWFRLIFLSIIEYFDLFEKQENKTGELKFETSDFKFGE